MKGWMLTFLTHNRAPLRFLHDLGWRAFLGFQLLVGGMIAALILHTVFAATLLVRLALGGPGGLVPADAWDWLGLGILAIGYGGAFAVVLSGLVHRGAFGLIPAQLLLPAYWVLHSWAALRAAAELVVRPAYWAKTTHGVTRMVRGPVLPARKRALRPRIG
jgi:hypothetical protein